MINPTQSQYSSFQQAYEHFNATLFSNTLPNCLITMQRKKGAYGYFSPDRFTNTTHKTDEIAMNPLHFRDRTPEKVLSTLVHEMVHLWQQHHGKPSRTSYHNKEWGDKMRALGLEPSSTGMPSGKATGQKVSHYIIDGAAFATHCAALMANGFELHYADCTVASPKAKKKNASKTKFTCPDCACNAWAKQDMRLICGVCEVPMETETTNDC